VRREREAGRDFFFFLTMSANTDQSVSIDSFYLYS